MWIAKLVMKPESKYSIFAPYTKKHNLSLIGYPISHYKEKNNFIFLAAGTLIGNEENKKEFIKDIKKDKRILKLESRRYFFVVKYKQKKRLGIFYDPSLILIKPVVIDKGIENWEIGTWEKQKLNKFIRNVRKNYSHIYTINLAKIKEEKLKDLFFLSLVPELTSKQKTAIDLAIKNGYYSYPREIELEKLAKLMGISFSTYQAHLRKAERKLIPYFFSKTQ